MAKEKTLQERLSDIDAEAKEKKDKLLEREKANAEMAIDVAVETLDTWHKTYPDLVASRVSHLVKTKATIGGKKPRMTKEEMAKAWPAVLKVIKDAGKEGAKKSDIEAETKLSGDHVASCIIKLKNAKKIESNGERGVNGRSIWLKD
jgi:hypothetical protein